MVKLINPASPISLQLHLNSRQNSLVMNRGRGRSPEYFSGPRGWCSSPSYSVHRNNKADGSCLDDQLSSGDGKSYHIGRGRTSYSNLEDRFSRKSSHGTPSDYENKPKMLPGYGLGIPNSNGIFAKQPASDKGSNSVSGYANKPRKVLGGEISAPKSGDNVAKHSKSALSSNCISGGDSCKEVQRNVKQIQTGEIPGERALGEATLDYHFSVKLNVGNNCESQLNLKSSQEGDLTSKQKHSDDTEQVGNFEHLKQQARRQPFDICLAKTETAVMLKPSLLVRNKERRKELMRANEGPNGSVLRSGMVLLKNYLSIQEQVKIVKICRDLGLGPGGFYQPAYRDGARLRLKMMCLGKNWDPDRSEYVESRPIDGAKPPGLPHEFTCLVEKAIKDSHALIERNSKRNHVEDILPCISSNLCIVNFYSETGRLGLHQDKDESKESLCKGLPVVSFSIGDAGEFLYSDEKDVDKADKVKLESGDVLIFGGKSRHIFHGVSSILPSTAPNALLDETNLRPGRLNLTFREY